MRIDELENWLAARPWSEQIKRRFLGSKPIASVTRSAGLNAGRKLRSCALR